MRFKKIIPIAILATMFGYFPCDNFSAADARTKVESTNFERPLTFGKVTVYDFGEVILHAYATNDALGDEFYLLESKTGLVLLESGAFKNNVEEFSAYIRFIGKPLEGVIFAYHPNGFLSYDKAPIYATKGALMSWREKGNVYNLTQNFAAQFGEDQIAMDLPYSVKFVNPKEKISIAGIEFKILESPDADGFEVEIPAINMIYRHMLGETTHNIIPSREYLDAEIEKMKEYKSKKYAMILTSHHTPETQQAVTEKLTYLKQMKKFANKFKTKTEFLSAMNARFPNYSGDAYLQMTADMLYK